jgi:hypothetical protein
VPGHHRLLARHRRPFERRLSAAGTRITILPVHRAYLASTRVLSALLVLVGAAMVVSTVARGGGVLALGVVLGTLLLLVGAGRLYLARGGGP